MELCFSLLFDWISEASSRQSFSSSVADSFASSNALIKLRFSLQRIPLTRKIEFIAASSVTVASAKKKLKTEQLSAIERGALHGFLLGGLLALPVRGIRAKLIFAAANTDADYNRALFDTAKDAIQNALYSAPTMLAEKVVEVSLDLTPAAKHQFIDFLAGFNILNCRLIRKNKRLHWQGLLAKTWLSDFVENLPPDWLYDEQSLRIESEFWAIPLKNRLENIQRILEKTHNTDEAEKLFSGINKWGIINAVSALAERIYNKALWLEENQFREILKKAKFANAFIH